MLRGPLYELEHGIALEGHLAGRVELTPDLDRDGVDEILSFPSRCGTEVDMTLSQLSRLEAGRLEPLTDAPLASFTLSCELPTFYSDPRAVTSVRYPDWAGGRTVVAFVDVTGGTRRLRYASPSGAEGEITGLPDHWCELPMLGGVDLDGDGRDELLAVDRRSGELMALCGEDASASLSPVRWVRDGTIARVGSSDGATCARDGFLEL